MQLRNKILKIVLSCLAVIPLLLPFQMSAETTTITSDNIIGTNVYTEPISNEYIAGTNNNAVSNTAIVHIDIELDQSYLGWINLGISVKIKNYYYGANPAYWGDTNVSLSGNYYVNGSTLSINVPISWNSQQLGYQMGSPTHLPNSSSDITLSLTNQGNVTPMGDLSTLQDILEVLQDIKQNVEIDILDELQNIVIQLGMANDYLDIIATTKEWDFPIESFNFISYWFAKNREFIEFYKINNYYTFPKFKFDAGTYIIQQLYVPQKTYVDMVYLIQIPANKTLKAFTSSMSLNSNENIQYFSDGTTLNYLRKSTFYVNTIGNQWINYPDDCNFIPIYCYWRTTPRYISTDFALQFGLTNSLLDNLGIIAQGTTASNNSSNNLESQNTQFSTDSSNLMNLEDTLGNQMNDNLEQIDTNFDVGNQFGSKFLASAEWVRNQYNTLTSNTPFGTFISFSLLIGLALLLMGRLL